MSAELRDRFFDPLSASQLPNVLVTAMERASADTRIRAMHESTTQISRHPVWTVAQAAIDRGELNRELTEEIVAAHTLGPIRCQRLFDGHDITPTDIERSVDAFLTAFTTRGERRRR